MNDPYRTILEPEAVSEILAAHRLWIASHRTAGRFAAFMRVVVRDMDATGLDLRDTHFRDVELMRCRFAGSDLSDCHLSCVEAVECDFSGAVLRRSYWSDTDLLEARFDDAILTAVSMRDVDLRDASFRGADLRACCFAECDLRGAAFDGAELRSARFDDCRLDGTSWVGANPPSSVPPGRPPVWHAGLHGQPRRTIDARSLANVLKAHSRWRRSGGQRGQPAGIDRDLADRVGCSGRNVF